MVFLESVVSPASRLQQTHQCRSANYHRYTACTAFHSFNRILCAEAEGLSSVLVYRDTDLLNTVIVHALSCCVNSVDSRPKAV
jgi:hypothetical protein